MHSVEVSKHFNRPPSPLRPGVESAWALQVAMFLFGAPPFLFPATTFDFFTGEAQPQERSLRVAHDCFALLCLHAMAFGVLSAFALRARDGAFRLGFARASSVFLVVWMSALASGLLESPERYGLAAGVLFLPGLFMLSLNVRHLLRTRLTVSRPHRDALPPAPLWTSVWWSAQAFLSVATGLATFVWARPLLRAFVQPSVPVHVMAPHQLRFSSAYAVLYGALSVMAMRTSRRGAWRLLTLPLALWPALTLVVILLRWDLSLYTALTWRFLAPAAVAALVNGAAAASQRSAWGDAHEGDGG